MVGTTAARWTPTAVVPAALVGVLIARLIAGSASNPTGGVDVAVRASADLAGAIVLGCGLLLTLAAGSRHVDGDSVWRVVAVAAGSWSVCEAALLVLGAVRSSSVAVRNISLQTFTEYVQNIEAGRVGTAVLVVAVAATVLATVVIREGHDLSGVLLGVPAAIALAARPVTGHMSQQTGGAPLLALHVVAAAIWLGLLFAMAVTLRSRTAWAEFLPRYSRIALWCVVVVALTGLIDASVRVGSIASLTDTGYGRLVITKTVLVLALVAGGWWHRRRWVRDIGAHRTDPTVSITRAATETAVMAVAFGVAAALSTTA